MWWLQKQLDDTDSYIDRLLLVSLTDEALWQRFKLILSPLSIVFPSISRDILTLKWEPLEYHKCCWRGTTQIIKMLAIIEQWEVGSGCHMDNTLKYVLLLFFKLVLDTAVFYLCNRKLYGSILSMCSLSIILADLVMVFCLAAVWFLGPDNSPVPLCSLLANASTTYGGLPLPMMFLGFLDYYLHDTYLWKQSALCKYLKYTALTLLGWILAIMYTFSSVKAELMELEYMAWIKALVCEVEESQLINYFILALFIGIICAMLPFFPRIPLWLRKADRLSEEREKQGDQKSFLLVSTHCKEPNLSEEYLEPSFSPPPPLWLSLMLGFAVFWMPYLTISVACLLFGFGVPAYITVNVLWLECTNSFLMGVVFWAKSNMQGPYSHLPENVCSWNVYWHLSKGTGQQQLSVVVFNPSKAKRSSLFYV